MPAKNRVKEYVENGFYHIYNRGVAKLPIFNDAQDYRVFLSYLKEYLSPPQPLSPQEMRLTTRPYLRQNYYQQIELLCFCLMPNHFHLLVKQKSSRTLEHFMKSLLIRYSIYFNKRYQRVGHLFQDAYKAILIEREGYFYWLSRYIHRNSLEIMPPGSRLSDYAYSSYPAYLEREKIGWLSTGDILSNFKNYASFVEDQNSAEPEDLSVYTLE